ncbi:MAG: metallophosphoesterase family protein [Polyangiales bacterium]
MQHAVHRRLAFLSDIHGNLPALRAVLQALAEQQVDAIYAAGDLVLGGPDPLGVFSELMRAEVQCIRGLGEDALLRFASRDLAPPDAASAAQLNAFRQSAAALGELVRERIRRLPDRLRLPLIDGSELLMVHGSPADPYEELSADLSDARMEALIAGDSADIIICGASHVPFERRLSEHLVVGVGSVGAAPGGQHADYAIVDTCPTGHRIALQWVELPTPTQSATG